MIELYCRIKFKTNKHVLNAECQELLDYVILRRERCPFGDHKPFCSHCKVHCYNKTMQAKIREVMRFSGPRMLLYHPIIAMKHVMATIKEKMKLRKAQKQLKYENKKRNS